jgi:phage tail tube protein FII
MASQVPPKKGVAFNLGVNLYTNTGGLITAPSSVTANVNKDFSTAYEAASSVSVASTNYGLIKVVLDSTQMNGDVIAVEVEDDTANSVPFTAILYTAGSLVDELSTAIYGESTKLSTLITAESTKLSTAIYGESTKLSTLVSKVSSQVSSVASVAESTAIANAVWASDAMMGRLGIVAYGTAQAADSTSITLASSHAFATDELNGAVVYITGDTGVGQARTIVDYAADKASVDAWTTTPAAAATYVVFAVPPASALMLPQVNVTQLSGDSTAADNAELFFDGTGYAGGTTPLVVKVGSIDTNALSAEAVSAGAVSKISSGLATDTAMSTSFAALSTKVDALSTTVQAESTRLSTAIYGESTKLSTQMDALSTTMQAESTRLSTAIYGESTKLSTGIASLSANLSTLASAVSSGATAAQASTAVWHREVASTYTAESILRGMAAVLLGKVSGSSGSTTVFRDVADGKNVVTAITDAEGNRTAVTLDLSS